MSTWDDKPNDYEHAVQMIERLRALLNDALYSMASDDYEDQKEVAAEIRKQLSG